MHQRRAIINAIKTKLKTLTVAGVWNQRTPPTRNAWPCITLYAEGESVETLTMHHPPREQERVVTLVINIWIKGAKDDEKVEQDMDSEAVKIESVVKNNLNIDEVQDVLLIGTDFKVVEDEPEIHVVTLTYHIYYRSTEFSPTTP